MNAWEQLTQAVGAHEALTDQARLRELEGFRRAVIDAFGDEPAVWLSADRSPAQADAVTPVPITDYLGMWLGARHATLLRVEPDGGWRAIADFGTKREVALVVPIMLNDQLQGTLVLGESLFGSSYRDSDVLILSLYATAICRQMRRQQAGLLPAAQAQEAEALESLRGLQELWSVLRARETIRVLVVDELPKTVAVFERWLAPWGFSVTGCTTEDAALAAWERAVPDLLIVDLSLGRRLPRRLLAAARIHAPVIPIFGLTTGHGEATHAALASGVRQVYHKPIRCPALLRDLFEAALERCIRSDGDLARR